MKSEMKLQKPQYEIFEQLPNGPVLRAVIPGLFDAQLTLSELGERTENECYALYPRTQEIVARVNTKRGELRESEAAVASQTRTHWTS